MKINLRYSWVYCFYVMREIAMVLSKKVIKLLIFTCVFFIILLLTDIVFLTEFNEYQGYVNNFSLGKLILSIFLLVFIICIGAGIRDDIKFFYLLLIIIYIYIPILVHFSVTSSFLYLIVCSLSVFSMAFFICFCNIPVLKILPISEKKIMLVLFFISVLFIISIVLNGGLRYWNLNLSLIYDYRRDAASLLPPFYAYLASNISKICLPMLVVLALKYKNYFIFCMGIFLSVLQFGLLAHKEVLLNPLVATFFFYAVQKGKTRKYLLWGSLGIVCMGFLDGVLFIFGIGNGWFLALFSTRTIMVPALLTDFYIDYFSYNDVYNWCYSKISLGFFTCPYNTTPPFQIGLNFFGNENMSANVGTIGSGYANLRLAGALLYSVLSGICIVFLSGYAKNKDARIVVSTSVLVIFNQLTSTDFLTSFFSNGLLLLLLLLACLPNKKGL